jgi:hypothetical protein
LKKSLSKEFIKINNPEIAEKILKSYGHSSLDEFLQQGNYEFEKDLKGRLVHVGNDEKYSDLRGDNLDFQIRDMVVFFYHKKILYYHIPDYIETFLTRKWEIRNPPVSHKE